jgi:hypothetical protein
MGLFFVRKFAFYNQPQILNMLIKTISNSASKRNVFNILFRLTSAFLRKYIEVIANDRFTNESVV